MAVLCCFTGAITSYVQRFSANLLALRLAAGVVRGADGMNAEKLPMLLRILLCRACIKEHGVQLEGLQACSTMGHVAL